MAVRSRELFGKVVAHLGAGYIGVTDCPELREILAICLTAQQAELVLCLGHPPAVHGARNIARKSGLRTAEAERELDDLADRGFIARMHLLGRKLYGLLPIMPGLYELPFMKPETYPEDKERLRELWGRYKRTHLAREIASYPTPVLRVVPVHAELPVEHRVFRHEDVERIIDRAGVIGIGLCACREVVHKCDAPRDVCLMFDQFATIMADNGFMRRVDAAEGKRALHRSEEAGLVHCAMNCTSGVQVLCNCCGCCCLALQAVVEQQRRGALAVSSYAARIAPRACTGCGECEPWCWSGAITRLDDHATVAEERCLGCGLCASQCHVRAIEMVPRAQPPARAPHNPLSLTVRMARERGSTEAIAKAFIEEVR